jgi:hypothetical protein
MNTFSAAIPGQKIGQFEIVTLAFSGNRFDVILGYHKQLGWSATRNVLHHHNAQNSCMVGRRCGKATDVAELLHPNVITKCEMGLTWTDQPLSAMAFVESSSLETVITAMKRTGRTVSTDQVLDLPAETFLVAYNCFKSQAGERFQSLEEVIMVVDEAFSSQSQSCLTTLVDPRMSTRLGE